MESLGSLNADSVIQVATRKQGLECCDRSHGFTEVQGRKNLVQHLKVDEFGYNAGKEAYPG